MVYEISVTNPAVTSGLGPVVIEADNPEEAVAEFIKAEGVSISDLASWNLAVWTIKELP